MKDYIKDWNISLADFNTGNFGSATKTFRVPKAYRKYYTTIDSAGKEVYNEDQAFKELATIFADAIVHRNKILLKTDLLEKVNLFVSTDAELKIGLKQFDVEVSCNDRLVPKVNSKIVIGNDEYTISNVVMVDNKRLIYNITLLTGLTNNYTAYEYLYIKDDTYFVYQAHTIENTIKALYRGIAFACTNYNIWEVKKDISVKGSNWTLPNMSSDWVLSSDRFGIDANTALENAEWNKYKIEECDDDCITKTIIFDDCIYYTGSTFDYTEYIRQLVKDAKPKYLGEYGSLQDWDNRTDKKDGEMGLIITDGTNNNFLVVDTTTGQHTFKNWTFLSGYIDNSIDALQSQITDNKDIINDNANNLTQLDAYTGIKETQTSNPINVLTAEVNADNTNSAGQDTFTWDTNSLLLNSAIIPNSDNIFAKLEFNPNYPLTGTIEKIDIIYPVSKLGSDVDIPFSNFPDAKINITKTNDTTYKAILKLGKVSPFVSSAKITFFGYNEEQSLNKRIESVKTTADANKTKIDSNTTEILNNKTEIANLEKKGIYKGTYATLSDARTSIPNPKLGDYILVGTAAPFLEYIYDTDWEQAGTSNNVIQPSADQLFDKTGGTPLSYTKAEAIADHQKLDEINNNRLFDDTSTSSSAVLSKQLQVKSTNGISIQGDGGRDLGILGYRNGQGTLIETGGRQTTIEKIIDKTNDVKKDITSTYRTRNWTDTDDGKKVKITFGSSYTIGFLQKQEGKWHAFGHFTDFGVRAADDRRLRIASWYQSENFIQAFQQSGTTDGFKPNGYFESNRLYISKFEIWE